MDDKITINFFQKKPIWRKVKDIIIWKSVVYEYWTDLVWDIEKGYVSVQNKSERLVGGVGVGSDGVGIIGFLNKKLQLELIQ